MPNTKTPTRMGHPKERVHLHVKNVATSPKTVANQDDVLPVDGINDVPSIAAIIDGPRTLSQTGIAPLVSSPRLFSRWRCM